MTKNSKLKVFHTLRFKISRMKIPNFNAMLSVKRHTPGLNFLNKIIYPLGGTITPNYTKLNSMFLSTLNLLFKKQGVTGVVKYLKVASVITQQVCAGHVLPDLTPLGPRVSRSKSGLPRLIPAYQRKLIMSGQYRAAKYWLTLLSLYRDLHFSGELKLKTITDPPLCHSSSHLLKTMIKPFTTLYCKGHHGLTDLSKSNALFPILKSGPQVLRDSGSPVTEYNTHPNSVLKTFYLIHNTWEGDLIKHSIQTIAQLSGNYPVLELWKRLSDLRRDKVLLPSLKITHSLLGKLSVKEEAAGKVRVFAMVDP